MARHYTGTCSGLVCCGIVAVLLASGCSDSDPEVSRRHARRSPDVSDEQRLLKSSIDLDAGVHFAGGRPVPSPRPADYVGSQACAACHAEIAELYKTHPMSRSLSPVGEAEKIETCPADGLDIAGPRRYRVSLRDGQVWHHEYLRDVDGELIYDQAERVQFALGSGQQGRAYLINHDGLFYQSPLGWYSSTGRWDLSPGYAPESHSRFGRRIGDGCLYCHAGRVAAVAEDRYEEPYFHEHSIGCERCHGPGAGHIAFHQRRDRSAKDSQSPSPGESLVVAEAEIEADQIVNPASLDHARREDVCNQCHLQGKHVIRRFGRGFYDFRPGDRLEDVFVVLSAGERVDTQGRHEVVSHVEQMRSSRCYVGSQGTLGCTSCHDPHFQPAPEQRSKWYRQRCATCHDEHACSLPRDQQLAEPALGSCVHCHMPPLGTTNVPHTAQTDHRVLRQSDSALRPPLPASRSDGESLPIFDRAEERLPDWEVARARGLSLVTDAWNRQNVRLALLGRRSLILPGMEAGDVDRLIGAMTDDPPALVELGASYYLAGDLESAERAWRRLLQMDAEHEVALGGLASIEMQRGNPFVARSYLQQLVRLVPKDVQWNSGMAQVNWQLGHRQEALRDAERVLELDPTKVDFRQWLVNRYHEVGDHSAAARHQRMIQRMLSRGGEGH